LPTNWPFGNIYMGKLWEHTWSNTSTPISGDYLSYQQDTIPKPQPKDTLDTIPEGINPLFLLIERKTQEVEAIKEQTEQAITPVVRRQAVPEVDTTCYICRDGSHRPLHTVVEQEGVIWTSAFSHETLYDAYHYNEFVKVNQQVFIETIPAEPVRHIHIKPLEQESQKTSWLFYPMLAMLILLVLLRLLFAKQINNLFRGALFFHIGKKIISENTIVQNRFFRMLDAAMLISLPVAFIQMINILELPTHRVDNYALLAIYISLSFVGYRAFRYISNKTIGFVSNQAQAALSLHINQLIYERLFGLVLIPLNLLMLYASSGAKVATLYITLGVLALVLIFRILRTLQVFLFNRFSMFYLFLYLCALEIIPTLIIVNEFF